MSYTPKTVRIDHFQELSRELERTKDIVQKKDKRIAELEKLLDAAAWEIGRTCSQGEHPQIITDIRKALEVDE